MSDLLGSVINTPFIAIYPGVLTVSDTYSDLED